MEVVDSPLFVLPAVTVCTFNRIKCFGFASVLETCAQDNCTHLQDYCQMGVFSGCFMSVAMPLMEVFEENGTLPFPTYILQSCPAQVAVLKPGMSDPKAMVKLMDVVALRELYRNLSTERRTAIGMVGQDMVLSCRVNGEPCSDFFNVTTQNTAENGNCFTFNGGSEVGEVRTGPSAGMDIEFKLNRDEFSYTPDNEKVDANNKSIKFQRKLLQSL